MSPTARVIDLHDDLLDAKDNRTRAKIIASAFESLEDRSPELRDMATAGGVRETELRLQKEIEQVRADLSKDIEQVRLWIEEVRADLSRQIAAGNPKCSSGPRACSSPRWSPSWS